MQEQGPGAVGCCIMNVVGPSPLRPLTIQALPRALQAGTHTHRLPCLYSSTTLTAPLLRHPSACTAASSPASSNSHTFTPPCP